MAHKCKIIIMSDNSMAFLWHESGVKSDFMIKIQRQPFYVDVSKMCPGNEETNLVECSQIIYKGNCFKHKITVFNSF